MGLITKTIQRRERGTRETLAFMAALAHAGVDVPIASTLAPDDLDETLRAIWFYVPDGPVETLRTIERMEQEFLSSLEYFIDAKTYTVKPIGFLAGDCDDAATFAAAVLLAARRSTRDVGRICFVAARPYHSIHFEHVFLVFEFRGQPTRVDPTAPHDADYSKWELVPFEV